MTDTHEVTDAPAKICMSPATDARFMTYARTSRPMIHGQLIAPQFLEKHSVRKRISAHAQGIPSG